MSIHEAREMHISVVVGGLAADAVETLQTMTDASIEDIVSTALINEAELRLHELVGKRIYVGRKRRRKNLKRLNMFPINIPTSEPLSSFKIIFLDDKRKPTP